MSFQITKRFEFAAAHHLPQLAADHKCRRPHGHNYTVTLILAADALDRYGFVRDYGDLAKAKKFIDDCLDHQDLNQVLDFAPTAERLAWWLFGTFDAWFDQLVEVVVCETNNTSASYRR